MTVSLRDSKAAIYAELEAFRELADQQRQELRVLKAEAAKPALNVAPKAGGDCCRCEGTGVWRGKGECFRCEGTGVDPGKAEGRAQYRARESNKPVSDYRLRLEAARAEAMASGKAVTV